MIKMNNTEFICPCGGGQSCIVDRRKNNDWVHEDTILIENKLPFKKTLLSKIL